MILRDEDGVAALVIHSVALAQEFANYAAGQSSDAVGLLVL
jgi:hypothetical protein